MHGNLCYLYEFPPYNLGTQSCKTAGLSQEHIEHVRKQFNLVSLHPMYKAVSYIYNTLYSHMHTHSMVIMEMDVSRT